MFWYALYSTFYCFFNEYFIEQIDYAPVSKAKEHITLTSLPHITCFNRNELNAMIFGKYKVHGQCMHIAQSCLPSLSTVVGC